MPNELKKSVLAISSILGGHAETIYFDREGEFLDSVGIDPEASLNSLVKPYGAIVPMPMGEFSGDEIQNAPLWITGMNVSAGVVVYDAGGTVVTYSAGLASEDGLANTGGAGNGMVFANGYVYLSTGTSVARLGPMDTTAPTLSEYWVSSLGMSTLTDSQYPSTRSVDYPNHYLHFHNDGRVYVLDYDGSNGRVHSFITDADGSNGSARFNDLTLPPGFMPFAAAQYGTDIAIVCSEEGKWATGSIPRGTKSYMVLWDAIPGNRPYRIVPIGDPLATAIVNKNGQLHVFCGNIDQDVKVLRYLGGYSFETVSMLEEASPPFAGAVDAVGNMVAWGAQQDLTAPTRAAGVMTLGYRSSKLPGLARHQRAKISESSTANPVVTCLKYLQPDSGSPVIGWRTNNTYGLDKKSGSATQTAVFKGPVWTMGKDFAYGRNAHVRRLTIPLTRPVSSGVSIQVEVVADNEDNAYAIATITNTLYPSEQVIDFQSLNVPIKHNFYLRFTFLGTVQIGVAFPVTVEMEING